MPLLFVDSRGIVELESGLVSVPAVLGHGHATDYVSNLSVRRNLALLGVISLVGLSGCGSAEVTPDAEYDSVAELTDVYLSSGVSDEECEEPNLGAVEKWGVESTPCGQHTVLAVYLTPEALDQSTSKEWNGPSVIPPDSSIITGPNWTIRTQTWNAPNVQEKFGGTVEQGSLQK
ncbi:hypothetical protein CXR23_07055 [Brevibacterium aurantiacum]|uniref:Uncharacterized protein n=1 Tax=Brevibacterium aurantiacum TaxID=273384 RepID=A0A3T0DDA9_BREAU|nr:hypothetical protein CXR23_07055 [Brevibacterium aurantiacum]